MKIGKYHKHQCYTLTTSFSTLLQRPSLQINCVNSVHFWTMSSLLAFYTHMSFPKSYLCLLFSMSVSTDQQLSVSCISNSHLFILHSASSGSVASSSIVRSTYVACPLASTNKTVFVLKVFKNIKTKQNFHTYVRIQYIVKNVFIFHLVPYLFSLILTKIDRHTSS